VGEDRPTVVIELADDPAIARDVAAGGIFVPGCTLKMNDDCTLLVRGPQEEIELPARVVYVDAAKGAGLQLDNFTPALRDHLTTILTAWASQPTEATPEEQPQAEIDEEAELTDEEKADPEKRTKARALHVRLRGLTFAQQIKHAASPDPQERIMLERYYGKNVWEALLRNPRLTPPEVSRMARMGTLPRTMVEIIVSNGAWLQMPEVRRSLLNNPRLSTDQILRVLRMLPKPELKLCSTMTVYPYAVRDAATRLMRDTGEKK
jgi:hypothetical protein